ncbi:NAD(P)H-hydrate dehydratase [Synoicihabitans lomoniglobus]|uniref:ADP-dependent (S)-NAD(P)H-hydrate dehydratase n=1 Tax=Synoicihabitans lomoniglobus TaxID=2909285 RepID=A0AAE9ZWP2_9BACT|nr:NAD(P)H-hydrate dehydratase [Opitutaceae bacterium LMO-M01]WED65656.1 NAD(P)H-hydrate dehydratase [Opitutaceae bacterium LMO-M01]
MPFLSGSHPILDCVTAAAWEARIFGGDESKEWPAMQAAGAAVADGIIHDLKTVSETLTAKPGRLLVLVGKGHNGGDALIAATRLLAAAPAWTVEVGFVFGQNRLRPLTLAAWRQLQHAGGSARVRAIRRREMAASYTVVIDGVFGFQFRPPLREPATGWLQQAADVKTSLRAAVDLPSGWAEAVAFQADVTYATGILKSPLLDLPNAGRIRYLDLGFFGDDAVGNLRVLTAAGLAPLQQLRSFHSDKRSHGHLAIVGGSRDFPGAVGLSVAAALHSGVGNVTAFVPESISAAFAARWPEAMWVGCPETEDGGLSLDAGQRIRTKWARASAALVGPGLGRDPETMALVKDLIGEAKIPLVLDADALQPEGVMAGNAPRILTPHQGEFDRITTSKNVALDALAWPQPTVTVLKGPITRVIQDGVIYHGVAGGPVLARGGSGDMLAGLIAGRLAAEPGTPLVAAAQGVVWHGLASQRVADSRGEVAVRSSWLIDEINGVLRAL